MKSWAWLLLSAAPAVVSADDVILRGGGQLSGEIVDYTSTAITVDVGPGRVTLPASRVDHVVHTTSPLTVYRERAARLGERDASGWLALGQWARENDLSTQAREAFERAVAIDPQNPAAHHALGHVLHDGAWMTPEESFRAQGLVPFEGEWISRDERQARIEWRHDAAQTEAARADAEARIAEARARAADAEARAEEADAAQGVPMGFGYGGYGFGFGMPLRIVRGRLPHRGHRHAFAMHGTSTRRTVRHTP